MRLKEQIQFEKQQMHPWRWRLIYIGVPLYLFLALGGCVAAVLVDVFALGAADGPGILTFVGIGWFILLSVATILLSSFITKVELKREMERYGYLLSEPAPLTGETVKINEVDGVSYTFEKGGITFEWEAEEGGQVFDEMRENLIFVPWEDADLCLATQNAFRRVHIALAIAPHDPEAEGGAFIIPMSEEVYSAMHAFGLMERTSADWAYLRYNPQDAFKQILAVGRILKMRDRKTGKVFVDETGEFTP